MTRPPSHVKGPSAGRGKPPRSLCGIRTSTDPGTRIVNRIVFKIGPTARVILVPEGCGQDSRLNLTVKSITAEEKSGGSFRVIQRGSQFRAVISKTPHPQA